LDNTQGTKQLQLKSGVILSDFDPEVRNEAKQKNTLRQDVTDASFAFGKDLVLKKNGIWWYLTTGKMDGYFFDGFIRAFLNFIWTQKDYCRFSKITD